MDASEVASVRALTQYHLRIDAAPYLNSTVHSTRYVKNVQYAIYKERSVALR